MLDYHLKMRRKEWSDSLYIPMICDTKDLKDLIKEYEDKGYIVEWRYEKWDKYGIYKDKEVKNARNGD